MTVFATICTLILMGIIIWSGTMMIQNQITHGNILPGLKISSAWGGIAVPLGGIMISMRSIQVCIEKLTSSGKEESAL